MNKYYGRYLKTSDEYFTLSDISCYKETSKLNKTAGIGVMPSL